MSASAANHIAVSWRDRVVVARFEIAAAAVILADILGQRSAQETDFKRLALCLQRLRALQEMRA
jgi:hypothetical protein